MFLPSSHSFWLVRSKISKLDIQSGTQESATGLSPPPSSDFKKSVFLPNLHSFWLAKSVMVKPVVQFDIQEPATILPPSSSLSDSDKPTISDKNKRVFLKAAGIAVAGFVGALILPKKADALIMGSSPTTGVVGVKDASNARINPATEETVSSLLKTSDLTFDTGAVNVKVTGAGSSSFSDSGNVAKSGLVDVDRHVQVDVLSSSLPTSASTESTLQTIAFGGTKYSLRMVTSGNYDYIGEATVGSATSSNVWRVKRLDNTSDLIILWADGNASFDNIWDNYASLSYS